MPAHAAGARTFTDPAGDAGLGPDLTQLVVSNDDSGQITFSFSFANRPAGLTGDDVVTIGIDADRRGDTGNPDGYEYLVGFLSEGAVVEIGRWSGSTFDLEAPQRTLRARDGGRIISVNRSELGNTSAFDMRVSTLGSRTGDQAPDGGVWTYELAVAARATIAAVGVVFTDARPRAGKPFAVQRAALRLSNGAAVAPRAFRCTAFLDDKTLRASRRCRWIIPRGARGKRFSVVLTASYGGETASFRPFRFTVR